MEGVHVSRHDGLQSLYHSAGGGNGIHSVVRMGSVTANAFYCDHKPVNCRRYVSGPQADDARFVCGVRMQPPKELHIVAYIRFQNFQRAQRGFLPGLEQDLHRSGKLLLSFLEQKRRAKAGRNMEVMSAGMHLPRDFRSIGKPRFLQDGERVDIATKRLHRPLLFSAYYRHKPRFQRKRQNLHPRIRQQLPDAFRGTVFFIGQLRISVKPLKHFF